ncbi:hypothetical protein C0J52_26725, partial [Blattella germanica]
KKKRKHKKEKIDEINENLEKGNTHIAHKEIKIVKEGFKARTHLCIGTDGIMLGDKEQIKNRWCEYFENLLNSNGVREEITGPSTILNINIENENPEPTVEPPDNIDIEIVIASLANNKAPGVDRYRQRFGNMEEKVYRNCYWIS